jgi:predicted transcriptional regulator
MTGKERTLAILETLADDATWDEVVDAIQLDIALEQSLADVERGDLIPHEGVVAKLQQRLSAVMDQTT